MKEIIGCNCGMCRSGLHKSRNRYAKKHSATAMARKKIRRTWNQLGKLIYKLSRGYSD